jgi:hypothetical protein
VVSGPEFRQGTHVTLGALHHIAYFLQSLFSERGQSLALQDLQTGIEISFPVYISFPVAAVMADVYRFISARSLG